MMDEKTIQITNNYLTHAQKHMLSHKKDFSSLHSIYKRFIKKDTSDPIFEYTKEMIKRMERDRMTSNISMQIAENLTPEIKKMKYDVIKMVLPLIVGFIMLITFSCLFSFTRPFNISNPFIIYWAIGMFVSGLLLGFGIFMRQKIKLTMLSKTMLYQASTAYGAAKMQGQGSFGAFRLLDEMKNKPGKELQIKITQPKIIHK